MEDHARRDESRATAPTDRRLIRPVSRPLIVDGGLATELRERGLTLHERLWSAGVYLERPEAVERLHRDYVEAGAEVLISASYQMSFAGLEREGWSHADAARALCGSVSLARAAARDANRPILVAASVGAYGATRADGSEYRGDYGLDVDALVAFHRERLELLATSGADLLAVETIPSYDEARAIHTLLTESDGPEAWVSFSCRDGKRIADGTPLARAARLLDSCKRVLAIGVNCTDPRHVSGLIDAIREGSDKRVVVYPNSGERWDATTRSWQGDSGGGPFLDLAAEWATKDVWAIGGCCRIGPETIRELAKLLRG